MVEDQTVVRRRFTLAELADHLGVEVVGDSSRQITGVRPLDAAGPDDLSFLHNSRYVGQARASAAGAILVADASVLPGRDLLVTPEPYLGLARVLALLHPRPRLPAGVDASAVVAPSATLGEGVAIGPHVSIGAGARVGDGTEIGPGSVIGRDAVIGERCLLHPRVVVEDGCCIGDRCILHAGVVIGSDGYGFATVAGVHHKVPQVGRVVLEDDVELGANVCVDRATLGETRIGRGTKVDNLVQIAHNVSIGEGTLLVSQVGISGSTRLGHHVIMAGQSGVAGHLRVGDGARVGAKSAVYKDVPDGMMVTGIPAQPHREWLRTSASLRRVEGLQVRIAKLEQRLSQLEPGGASDDDRAPE
jgi:UDP-3-O-[3-hydroxymyristoyl] glucosamine N-acyltransferase